MIAADSGVGIDEYETMRGLLSTIYIKAPGRHARGKAKADIRVLSTYIHAIAPIGPAVLLVVAASLGVDVHACAGRVGRLCVVVLMLLVVVVEAGNRSTALAPRPALAVGVMAEGKNMPCL